MLCDNIRAKDLQAHELPHGVHEWSEQVRKYGNTKGKTRGDPVKMTVLQNMRPKEVRTHLQLNDRNVHRNAKEAVLAYVNVKQAITEEGEPMEVDGQGRVGRRRR